MSKTVAKPAAKPDTIHLLSSRHPDKGRCGKRAGGHHRTTKITAIVTCPECRPVHVPNHTVLAAFNKMAGVTS